MPQAAYVLYKRPNSVKKNIPGDFVTQEKEPASITETQWPLFSPGMDNNSGC